MIRIFLTPSSGGSERLSYFFQSSQTVEGWYTSELPCYNFATHSDVTGPNACASGHMTQIIWKSSKKLGCGYAACNGSPYWSCNFDPGGNMVGAHAQNIDAPISPKPSCAQSGAGSTGGSSMLQEGMLQEGGDLSSMVDQEENWYYTDAEWAALIQTGGDVHEAGDYEPSEKNQRPDVAIAMARKKEDSQALSPETGRYIKDPQSHIHASPSEVKDGKGPEKAWWVFNKGAKPTMPMIPLPQNCRTEKQDDFDTLVEMFDTPDTKVMPGKQFKATFVCGSTGGVGENPRKEVIDNADRRAEPPAHEATHDSRKAYGVYYKHVL